MGNKQTLTFKAEDYTINEIEEIIKELKKKFEIEITKSDVIRTAIHHEWKKLFNN